MVVMVMLAAIINFIMTATVHSYGKIVHRPHTIKNKITMENSKRWLNANMV
jgi:hypothetical protein